MKELIITKNDVDKDNYYTGHKYPNPYSFEYRGDIIIEKNVNVIFNCHVCVLGLLRVNDGASVNITGSLTAYYLINNGVDMRVGNFIDLGETHISYLTNITITDNDFEKHIGLRKDSDMLLL